MLNGPQQLGPLLVKSGSVSELLGPKEPFVVLLPFAEFQFSQYVFGPVLFLLSIFIILIILLQRGRGGGLTGALGGAGGSSAFGVKAGDVFTKITAFLVLGWIILSAFVCWFYLPPKLDIETDGGINTTGAGSLSVGPSMGANSGESKPQPPTGDQPVPGIQATEGAPPLPSSPPAEEPKKEDTAAAPSGSTPSLPPAEEPTQPAAPVETPKLPDAEPKAETPKAETTKPEGAPASDPAAPVLEPPATTPEKPAETPPATPADTPSEPPKS